MNCKVSFYEQILGSNLLPDTEKRKLALQLETFLAPRNQTKKVVTPKVAQITSSIPQIEQGRPKSFFFAAPSLQMLAICVLKHIDAELLKKYLLDQEAKDSRSPLYLQLNRLLAPVPRS